MAMQYCSVLESTCSIESICSIESTCSAVELHGLASANMLRLQNMLEYVLKGWKSLTARHLQYSVGLQENTEVDDEPRCVTYKDSVSHVTNNGSTAVALTLNQQMR